MDFKDIKERELIKDSTHPNDLMDIDSNHIDTTQKTTNYLDHPKAKSVEYNNIDDLKKVIYQTYSTSVDKSKDNKRKERKKLKNIMNLLIYLQMKKVELKLNYFNDFEKMIQYEKQQIKTLESQLIGDKIHLAMKKHELTNLSNKLKDSIKTNTEYLEVKEIKDGIKDSFRDVKETFQNGGCNGIIEKAEKFNVEMENRIMDLN